MRRRRAMVQPHLATRTAVLTTRLWTPSPPNRLANVRCRFAVIGFAIGDVATQAVNTTPGPDERRSMVRWLSISDQAVLWG